MLSRLLPALAVCITAAIVAARRLRFLYRVIAAGGSAAGQGRTFRFKSRARREVRETLLQRGLLTWTGPGVAHLLVFWGFVVLLATIIEAVGDLFSPTFAIPWIGRSSLVGLSEDVSALAVLVGVTSFAAIRVRSRPLERTSRFYGSHAGAAWAVLGLISAVIVTLLVYRGAQANTGDLPYGSWAFASHEAGRLLHPLGISSNRMIESIFVVLNISVIAGFLVFLVHSKHLHIFLAPLNIAFARFPRALGALATTPDLDPANFDEHSIVGVGAIDHFNWKQRLDFATCTECGRCQSVCPAWSTGKPLSPKLVIMALRDEMLRAGSPRSGEERASYRSTTGGAPAFLLPGVIEPDALWSCTTCGACVEECPVDIEHVDAIVDMRRFEVMMEARLPAKADSMLRNIESRGDPFGLGRSGRLAWTADLDFDVVVVDGALPDDVEYLFWVGCAGAFDDRAVQTTQALARLLHRADVKFAVLGTRESCLGDPARRLGNEYVFQNQATEVIETLQEVRAHRIIASCPHCLNTIRNEFPQLGASFEVLHHSEVLASLVAEGRLVPTANTEKVVFHDPCYLGRHNRIFEAPRAVLDSIGTSARLEMERAGAQSFCCGAGGARMWLEESLGSPINLSRADEAVATGADVIATGCPYCKVMLDDGVARQGRAGEVEVLDLAQLLDRAMPGTVGRGPK